MNGLLSATVPGSEVVTTSDGEGSGASKSVGLSRLSHTTRSHHLRRAKKGRKESNNQDVLIWVKDVLDYSIINPTRILECV